MTNDKKKKGKFSFKAPDAMVLIFILMIVCAILTYILPAGTYDRILDPATGKEMVDPTSFHNVPNTPVSIWELFKSFQLGMNEAADIINFLFIIGGTFGVLNDTGALDAMIYRTSVKFKGKEHFVIFIFLFIWALGGSFLGNFEECLAFIPMQISLCLALGFDSITGVALGLFGVCVGYFASIMNPITTGVAQSIADLPIYSGLEFRFVLWVFALAGTTFFLMRYAKKIKENPQLSVTYELDKNSEFRENFGDVVELTSNHKIILAEFVIGILFMIFGVIRYSFYLTEMSAVFIIITIVMGLTAKMHPNDLVASFVKGCSNLLYACICVGFARGMTIIMTEGNILDVIVHSTTSILNNVPSFVSAPLTFIVVAIINLFIPSGSGKAVILMPIMVPMADVLGITRQTITLAYHMGDAITNIVSPANAALMAALAIAKIPWTTWMKWFMKLFLYFIVLGCLACIIAVAINFGPF